MFPVRLIYASTVADCCDPEDIEHILEVAREHNPARDITGMLCFTTDYFLQCLEGPRTAVNHLYQMILADRHHEEVVLLEYSEITGRMFEDWSMAYLAPPGLDQSLLRTYFREGVFNPYALDSASSYALIKDLGDSLETTSLLE